MNNIDPDHRFFIKSGYQPRTEVVYFVDSYFEEFGILCQPEIYAFAAYLARHLQRSWLVDVGCGRAEKLMALHPEFNVLGIDFGSNIEYCRSQYSAGKWLTWDIDQPGTIPIPEDILCNAVVICADVIEHLVHPNHLLDCLKQLLNMASVAVVSTPDRDLMRGIDHSGPPDHPYHIREWNSEEFKMLLQSWQFNIKALDLTLSTNYDYHPKTILGLLGNNTSNASWLDQALDNFRKDTLFYKAERNRLSHEIAKHGEEICVLESQISSLNRKAEADLTALNTEYSTTLAQFRQKHEANTEELKAQFAAATVALRQELIAEFEAKIADVQHSYKQKLSEIWEQLERSLHDAEFVADHIPWQILWGALNTKLGKKRRKLARKGR